MPIYLYECDSCGVRFERLERMSAEPLTRCPECDGEIHRVIQPVGIIFKGSGFYVTDNRKGSSPTLAPAKEKDRDKDKDKETTKAAVETKAATETTSKETKASE